MDVRVGFRICSPHDATPGSGFVYVLRCPDTNDIRYVGSSTNVMTRYTTHLAGGGNHRSRGRGNAKDRWIAAILDAGKFPVLEVVSVLPVLELIDAERKLVRWCESRGCKLTNSVKPAKNTRYGSRSKFLSPVHQHGVAAQ